MFNLKYISKMFYIHTELPYACFTLVAFIVHAFGYAMASEPFVQAVMAFGALVYLIITSCVAYGIYRFEKKYGRTI